MDRRTFLTLGPAVACTVLPAAAASIPLAPMPYPVVLLGSAPSLQSAAKRAVDQLAKTFDRTLISAWWGPEDLEAPNGRMDIGVNANLTHAIFLERDADAMSEVMRTAIVKEYAPSVLRIVSRDPNSFSQTRNGLCPSSIAIVAQRKPPEVVINVPRLWERQLFRQFSLATAQPDGSRRLDDFEEVGMPMSEIFWREDELIANVVANTIPRMVNGQLLEDAIGRIDCTLENGDLKETLVTML